MHIFKVLYMGGICQFGLHAVLWAPLGTLTRLLAAEPRSTARLLSPCQYLCGTILVAPYSMVWDYITFKEHANGFLWA